MRGDLPAATRLWAIAESSPLIRPHCVQPPSPAGEGKASPRWFRTIGGHFYFSITSRQGRFSASSLRRWLRQISSAASAAPNRMTAARLGRPTVGSSGVIHLSTSQNSTNHKSIMAAVMAPYRTPFSVEAAHSAGTMRCSSHALGIIMAMQSTSQTAS